MDMIHQYVRGKGSNGNNKIGVMLGSKIGDAVIITTSKANITHGDKFDKGLGLRIAYSRRSKYKRDGKLNIPPTSFEADLQLFAGRCSRYFKTDNIISG